MRYLQFAALALALMPVISQADIYKWVDEDGTVHYEQSPPPDRKTEKFKNPSAGDSSAADQKRDAYRKALQPADANADDKEKSEQDSAPQVDEAARKKACNQARTALQQLQTQNRIQTVNEDGERAYLTEEQRQQKADKAREIIQKHCE